MNSSWFQDASRRAGILVAPLKVRGFVWNVMYDDFLRMDLPAGASIIGFADDAIIMCAADDVGILELRINESLRRQSVGRIADA